jgi:hypothetical protein
MDKTCSTRGRDENPIVNFFLRNVTRRPLGRYRRRWVDVVRVDLRVTGWEVVDWIHLAQDRDQWQTFLTRL